ncbi:hypothetical protein FDZ71_00415 [bacterium]|nr:MAG: hypothetical protein FDZ71_00415 [bacterium]
MIAIFEIEEQCLELGGGDLEPWINSLEDLKHLAVMQHVDMKLMSRWDKQLTDVSFAKVVEATTGLEGEIGLESRTGILYVESEHPDAFAKLVAVVCKEAIEGPLDREA